MDIAFILLTAVLTALSAGLIAMCHALQGENP